MTATDTTTHNAQVELQTPAAFHTSPRLKHLQRRLLEALDELWNGFVDPNEALWDDDEAL